MKYHMTCHAFGGTIKATFSTKAEFIQFLTINNLWAKRISKNKKESEWEVTKNNNQIPSPHE